MKLFFLLIVLLLSACSGVSVIEKGEKSKPQVITTAHASQEIEEAQKLYRQGDLDKAVQQLNILQDANITPSDFALKYNLLGVISFTKNEFQPAIGLFNTGLTKATGFPDIQTQINLQCT